MRSSFDMAYDMDEDFTPRTNDSPQRAPSPGISAVLSVVIPGLGQIYSGRLLAGALWFVGTAAAYSAILIPGFLVHAVCVWSAYKSAIDWTHYS